MNKKTVLHSVAIVSLLTIVNCQAPQTSNSQGKNMQHIKVGEKIDTSTWTTTSSGLKFTILKKGNGSKPLKGETVFVDYTGWLWNNNSTVGTKFDSSIDRGQHFSFPLKKNYVIAGWDETVADMQIGETRLVIIPANLGYGARGAGAVIPGNATLLFEITLHKVQ